MLVPMAGTPTNIEGGARCVSSARRDLCGDEEKSSSLPRPSPDTGSLEKFSAFVPRTLVYKLSICEAYRLGKEKIQCVYCSEFGSHRRSNRPAALSLATGLDRTGGGHAHVGPIDFMGTCGLTNYVITTEAAHILIDGGMPQTAASVEASIRKTWLQARGHQVAARHARPCRSRRCHRTLWEALQREDRRDRSRFRAAL